MLTQLLTMCPGNRSDLLPVTQFWVKKKFECIFPIISSKIDTTFCMNLSQQVNDPKGQSPQYTHDLGIHLCKLWTFKNFFTAPWLKNLVEYSYLLPKYSVKNLREKKWAFFFISLFEKEHFTCKSMESGIIEGTITSILEHYKVHFDLSQKIAHLFFHEICTVWMVNAAWYIL